MKICELLEGRNNPKLNPKISAYQVIADRLKNTNDKIGDVTNLFVSFTEINKLGINPRSKWFTPLGIYAYPAEYIKIQVNSETEDMSELPFAGDAPYVNLFEVQGNIIQIDSISNSDANIYYKKIADVYAKAYISNQENSGSRGQKWKTAVDEVEKIIHDSRNEALNRESEGGYFWYVTMKVAALYANELGITGRRRNPIAWNKLFRKIGIDGFVDSGKGIIHTSEPTQGLFFHKGAIVNNSLLNNKWSKKSKNSKFSKDNPVYMGLPNFTTSVKLKKDINNSIQNNDIDSMLEILSDLIYMRSLRLRGEMNKLIKRLADNTNKFEIKHKKTVRKMENDIEFDEDIKAKLDMPNLVKIFNATFPTTFKAPAFDPNKIA